MLLNILPYALACIFAFIARASWHIEIADNGYGGGLAPAITLDSSDIPHMCHSRGNSVYHTWHNGTGWQSESVWGSSYAGTEASDICMDNNDMGHVSFARAGMLYYSSQTSPSEGWTTEMVTPMVYSSWTSLGLNSSGYPEISTYADDELLLVEWNGSSWVSEQVSSVGDEGDCNSLVLEQDGTPHIAFCAYSPTSAVKYSYRDEYGVWQTMTVDDTMGSDPQGTSLAIDDQGYPHISYNTSSEIRYASWNGASWDIQTVDAIDTGLQEFDTSLALDQYGFPHIAHCLSTGDSLMYSVNQGGGWLTESVCSIDYDYGGDPDLVLDDQGRPHIAFYSGLYGEGLMYAFNDQPSEIGCTHGAVGMLDLLTTPNPFSGTLSISFVHPLPGVARILDVSGRQVAEIVMNETGRATWHPDEELPDGTYFVVAEAGDQEAVEQCVLLR